MAFYKRRTLAQLFNVFESKNVQILLKVEVSRRQTPLSDPGDQNLATISISYPQVAFAALSHGFSNKWTFLIRTIPNISSYLQPLEEAIRYNLLPVISGKSAFSNLERSLFVLPTHLDDLGISNPCTIVTS